MTPSVGVEFLTLFIIRDFAGTKEQLCDRQKQADFLTGKLFGTNLK